MVVQQIVHLATKCAQSSLCSSPLFTLEKLTCRVVMVGTSHGRSSINITATAKNHSGFISELLVAHVLSGYDTVPCLFGRV